MSWADLTLSDCAKFLSGGTPSKQNPVYWVGSTPWVSCKDMKALCLHDAEDHVADIAIGNGTRLVQSHTILIVVRGMILEKEFPVAITQCPMTFNQDIKALQIKPGIDTYFLLYTLLANRVGIRALADEAAHGTKRLQTDRLLGYPVRIPTLPVQRRIAAILSAYDDLIENNTRRIAILEEMARRLYEEWFVKFRFPGHNAEMNDEELPDSWRHATIGSLVSEIRDAVHPSQIDSNTPYVGLEHIPRRSITLNKWSYAAEVTSSKLKFKRGDILFGKIRPYFHKVVVAPVEGVCSMDTILLRPLDPKFFSFSLCCIASDAFIAHATQTSNGTKMPRASWEVLQHYPVVLPPEALLSKFNCLIEGIVNQSRVLAAQNANLRAQRDLLLPKLISGEIDVSEAQETLKEAVA